MGSCSHDGDGSVVGLVGLLRRHCDYGDAQVDPQHVDDAEAEEGEAGDDVATLHALLVPAAA